MDAVESGAVKTVVTKDLSRLGRNYLQVGLFTEITFPKKGVRFIAINDGVDSAQGDNDMSALRNLFNEWMVRDTSKKIKAVFRGIWPPFSASSMESAKNRYQNGINKLLIELIK